MNQANCISNVETSETMLLRPVKTFIFPEEARLLPSARLSLVLIVVGLAALVGCGSSSNHTAYVTVPTSNAVAAFRIDNSSDRFTTIVGSPYPAGTSPSSVLVHPSGRFVYVANQGEDNIELFSIDSTIGSLLEVKPRTLTGRAPTSLAMDSAGTFLFALNQISSSISSYSIAASGALSPVAGSPLFIFPNPVALALTPSGKFLYVVNANLASVFAYTVTSGVVQPAGPPVKVGAGPLAIAVDPAEKFVFVGNVSDNTVSVLSIDSSTGALTALGTSFTGIRPVSLAVLGKFLYVANQGGSTISAFSVDPATGILTQIATSPFSSTGTPSFIVIDPNGKFMYVGSQSGNTISVMSIDSGTGVLTSSSESGSTINPPTSMSVTK